MSRSRDERSKRIRQWIVWLLVAAIFCGISQVVEYRKSLREKQPLTLYAPEDMQDAFEFALKRSSLRGSYYIVMSEDPNSNICVDYGKQGDENYEKFAYSPFVVAYSSNASFYKKLKKAKVCSESAYDSNSYEINFLKVIEEAIGDGKWENLGIIKMGDLKVFYPDEESEYWSDFHDFLLVTVNDGRYPQNETELENAEEVIQKFIDSRYTEGVTNFYEQAKRTNGFPESVFYILPENIARDIGYSEPARFFYPNKTVYVNYYVKGDELGTKVIEAFDETNFWNSSFYSKLHNCYYRNAAYTELSTSAGNIYGEGNVYNLADVPTS